MGSVLGWLIRRVGIYPLLVLALLLVGLVGVAAGLAEVVQSLDMGLLWPLACLGLLLAWGLASGPWPGWLAGSAVVILGLEIIITRVGRLGGQFLSLLEQLVGLAWSLARWPVTGWPDVRPLLITLAGLSDGVSVLLARLAGWLLALLAGEPAFDPVATALAWSLLLWLVAAWAGWAIHRRQQPLPALAPAGTLLVVTLAYGGRQLWLVPLLLAITLLLMALVGHAVRERTWEERRIDYAPAIRLDLALVVLPAILGLVLVAAITPSVSVSALARLAQQAIWGQPVRAGPVANSLGLKPVPAGTAAFDQARTGGLPRRHLLGSGPELSERVVMTVTISQPALPAGEEKRKWPIRPYWRSLTYDRYTGQGWLSGPAEIDEYRANQAAGPVSLPDQMVVEQEVQVAANLGGLVHTIGSVVRLNRPYQVAWRSNDDAFAVVTTAVSYRAESTAAVASEAELRTAGTAYPRWVQRRYLALPPSVPDRVRALARDLTATAATPYDRARAIEAYLRTFPYNLDLPLPPSGRDVVDYFLFDLKQGYCDYYATAMVVLARSAGLPARLVVGYAGRQQARQELTEADAHAWPEIYFPGYGWIEFEPTLARPVLARPAGMIATEPPPDTGALTPGWRWGWLVLPGGLVALVLAGTAWVVVDSWRLRRLPPSAAVARLYRRLERASRWVGIDEARGLTPYEFAGVFAGRIAGLFQGRPGDRFIPPANAAARRLVELYVCASYSGRPLSGPEQAEAIRIWQRLWWWLWLARLRRGR